MVVRVSGIGGMLVAGAMVTAGAAWATPDSAGRIATAAAAAPVVAPGVAEAAPPLAIAAPPACARKVKVVYSGYGEADRAACPTGIVATR